MRIDRKGDGCLQHFDVQPNVILQTSSSSSPAFKAVHVPLHLIPWILLVPFHSNSITELPDELEQLPYLRTLRLKYNQLRRLPPVVGRLPQLMVLELAGNQITRLEGSVVAGLSLLKELDLSGNGLAELPASIGTLPKLEVRAADGAVL